MLIIKDTQTIFHRMPIVHKLTAILRIKWVKAPTNAQQKKKRNVYVLLEQKEI